MFLLFLFLMHLGCVELLLETIHPFLLGSSPLLSHALKIVEVLGAYRYELCNLWNLFYLLDSIMVNHSLFQPSIIVCFTECWKMCSVTGYLRQSFERLFDMCCT